MRVRTPFFAPLLAAVGLAAAACAGPASSPTPVPTATPTPTPVPPAVRVSLPRDDAPHPEFNTEWWYYSGHLATADGRSFSFHYAVFQIAAQGGLFADVAHVAVTDATLADAVQMATANPARLLGVDDRVGSVEVGREASLTLFRWQEGMPSLSTVATIVRGEVVYRAA